MNLSVVQSAVMGSNSRLQVDNEEHLKESSTGLDKIIGLLTLTAIWTGLVTKVQSIRGVVALGSALAS